MRVSEFPTVDQALGTLADSMNLAAVELVTWGETLRQWLASPWLVYPTLIAAGFIAGIVNAIAGGGSFLTLPALMFLGGLDAKIANATNRVAVLLSSGSSTAVFHRHGHLDWSAAVRIAVPTLGGVPFGVALVWYLPKDVFQMVFGALFLVMAVFLALRPKALLNPEKPMLHSRLAETLVFGALGVYMGFLQAGMGVLLLVAMAVFHARELVGANAIKAFIAFAATIFALVGFIWLGQVRWVPGLVMAIGNFAGGLVGARLAIHKGQKFIFVFLILVMIATGIKLVVNTLG